MSDVRAQTEMQPRTLSTRAQGKGILKQPYVGPFALETGGFPDAGASTASLMLLLSRGCAFRSAENDLGDKWDEVTGKKS